MDFLSTLSTWAEPVMIDGELYFFASRNKVLDELPMLTDKPDTVYRLYKSLNEKSVIDYMKQGRKDLVRLTAKGKKWNSEKNPSLVQNSENFPNKLGKKSESNSENFPTDNNTIIDNNTSDKESALTFDAFWDLYDKKRSRVKCEKKWKKISDDDRARIFEHVPLYKESEPIKQFRKDPLTYLNGECWKDEIIPRRPSASITNRLKVERGEEFTRKAEQAAAAVGIKMSVI